MRLDASSLSYEDKMTLLSLAFGRQAEQKRTAEIRACLAGNPTMAEAVRRFPYMSFDAWEEHKGMYPRSEDSGLRGLVKRVRGYFLRDAERRAFYKERELAQARDSSRQAE